RADTQLTRVTTYVVRFQSKNDLRGRTAVEHELHRIIDVRHLLGLRRNSFNQISVNELVADANGQLIAVQSIDASIHDELGGRAEAREAFVVDPMRSRVR